MAIDFWNPNTWSVVPHEFRIYLDNRAETFAVLDEIDYYWAIKWRWNVKATCHKHAYKAYARRAISVYHDREKNQGKLIRNGSRTVYLHIEILKRTTILPPTPDHVLVDHINGNSLDCRRLNLRWVTPSINTLNKNGKHAQSNTQDANRVQA